MKMRLQKNLGRALAVALIGFGLAGSADAQIIVNGGFEDGAITNGWNASNGGGQVEAVTSAEMKGSDSGTWHPASGSFFGLLRGTNDGQTQTLSQVFSTLGDSGTLSFKYFFDSAEADPVNYNDSFTFQIDRWDVDAGQYVNEFIDVMDVQLVGSGRTDWLSDSIQLTANTQYRVLGTLVNPSSNAFHQGPFTDFNSIAGIDDIVFTADAPPAVPEPTSMTLLLAGGAIGLVLRARRKSKQAPANES